MELKKIVPVIIFALASVVLILGIAQISLFSSAELSMLDDARLQGAPEEDVDKYYIEQYVPKLLTAIIMCLGFVATLVSAGLISLQLGRKGARYAELKASAKATASTANDMYAKPVSAVAASAKDKTLSVAGTASAAATRAKTTATGAATSAAKKVAATNTATAKTAAAKATAAKKTATKAATKTATAAKTTAAKTTRAAKSAVTPKPSAKK
ncbi:MAG: hypothetical protein FWG00_01205 [Coriobacteriia bacterium]|jgi:hypothetical protein|nr:hypothetical protein [Coriobacteriia bacterium]